MSGYEGPPGLMPSKSRTGLDVVGELLSSSSDGTPEMIMRPIEGFPKSPFTSISSKSLETLTERCPPIWSQEGKPEMTVGHSPLRPQMEISEVGLLSGLTVNALQRPAPLHVPWAFIFSRCFLVETRQYCVVMGV